MPPKATSVEMSSEPSDVLVTAGTNSVPQVESPLVVRFTRTEPPRVHVAHSWPVESLSMTRVSELQSVMVCGKPPSRAYVSVPAL